MRNTGVTFIACALTASLLSPQTECADRSKAALNNTTAAHDLIQQGKAVYVQWCLGCHGPLTGMGRFPSAGTYRLQQRYNDAVPAMLEDRVDLTPEVIRTAVRHGMPIMPPFRKTEVTDAELDAVIAYLTQKKHK
jgi:mono/diheme cytochrome c family protein